jgi:hypothetical protein
MSAGWNAVLENENKHELAKTKDRASARVKDFPPKPPSFVSDPIDHLAPPVPLARELRPNFKSVVGV